MTAVDEKHWLDRARAGDRAAFGELVRLHHRRIHGLAVHLCGCSARADDVTQETFLRAYRAIGGFQGQDGVFTWLYRICVNVSINHRRAGRRVVTDLSDPRVPEPTTDDRHDPAYAAEQSQAYRRLAAAMDQLSESLRTTVVLALVEQISYKDIALILGCSEGTVAWRIHEARRQLRLALADEVLTLLDTSEPRGGARGRRA